MPEHGHVYEDVCTSACPANPWHDDLDRCIASTDRHTRCARKAIRGEEFCRTHDPKVAR